MNAITARFPNDIIYDYAAHTILLLELMNLESLAAEEIASDKHKNNTNLDAELLIDRKKIKPPQIIKQNNRDTPAELASAISQGFENIKNGLPQVEQNKIHTGTQKFTIILYLC